MGATAMVQFDTFNLILYTIVLQISRKVVIRCNTFEIISLLCSSLKLVGLYLSVGTQVSLKPSIVSLKPSITECLSKSCDH